MAIRDGSAVPLFVHAWHTTPRVRLLRRLRGCGPRAELRGSRRAARAVSGRQGREGAAGAAASSVSDGRSLAP